MTYDPRYDYWAALNDDEEFLPLLFGKLEDHYKQLDNDGVLQLWRESYNLYYNLSQDSQEHEGSQVKFVGPNGHVLATRTALARTLIQHMLLSVTATRINYEPRAINDDFISKQQTYAAKGILDYQIYYNQLDHILAGAAERGLIFGSGYVYNPWDLITNDLKCAPHTPLTVITDLDNTDVWNPKWAVVVESVNKFDLIKRFKLSEEDIDKLYNDVDVDKYKIGFEKLIPKTGSDDISVFHFYHSRCPSLEKGRYICAVNQDFALHFTPIEDEKGGLPYSKLPIYMIRPDDQINSPYGYSPLFDLIAPQKLSNAVQSTMFSTVRKFGQPFLGIPESATTHVDALTGLTVIKYPDTARKPEMIDLLDFSQNLFKLKDEVKQDMQLQTTVSNVALGQKGGNSGTQDALMHANTTHFLSRYHASYIRLCENVGTSIVRIIKDYSNEETLIDIVGVSGKPTLTSFKPSMIDKIDHVVVDVVNPLLRTPEGKLKIAELLLNKGIINKNEFLEILDTGQIKGSIYDDRDRKAAIDQENELLLDPSTFVIERRLKTNDRQYHIIESLDKLKVLVTDPHPEHVTAHLSILQHPQHRNDDELIKKVYVHVEEHLWQAEFGDKKLLMVSGGKPLPNINEPSKQGKEADEAARALTPQGNVPDPGIKLPKVPRPPNVK